MDMYERIRQYDNTPSPSVGTGGRVEWMWGPCACPRASAIRWLDETWVNRVAKRTGTRPPPISASTPCPYRTGADVSRLGASGVLFCSGFGWLWSDGGADPDGLDVDELSDAEGGEFAAIATPLDAAEGQARVACGHAVYENAARFEVASDGAPALDVARPQIAAQSKVGVVGQF